MAENLFVGETPDALHRAPPGWMWLKPTVDGLEIYELHEGSWVLRATSALVSGVNTSGEGLVEVKNIKVRNGVIVDLEEG